MWPLKCSFWAKEVCTNFRRSLLHGTRRRRFNAASMRHRRYQTCGRWY